MRSFKPMSDLEIEELSQAASQILVEEGGSADAEFSPDRDPQQAVEKAGSISVSSEEVAARSDSDESALAPAMEPELLASALEAILFISPEPVSIPRLIEITEQSEPALIEAAAILQERIAGREGGLELVRVNGALHLRTVEQFSTMLQRMRAAKPKRLSGPALETLAIIAYRQPIVKSDIEKLRGVDATPTLKTLMERELITISGQQPTAGQPALYSTTELFLKTFGLNSVKDLPALRELSAIESDPGDESSENSAEDKSDEGEQQAAADEEIQSPLSAEIVAADEGAEQQKFQEPESAENLEGQESERQDPDDRSSFDQVLEAV